MRYNKTMRKKSLFAFLGLLAGVLLFVFTIFPDFAQAQDTTKPTVSITRSPSGTVTSTNSVTFTTTASDSSGVDDVRVLIDTNNDGFFETQQICTSSPCTIVAGPWVSGTFIQYFGTARDASPNDNFASTLPEASFTVTAAGLPNPPTLVDPADAAEFPSSGDPDLNSTSIRLDWNAPTSGTLPTHYSVKVHRGSETGPEVTGTGIVPSLLTQRTILNGQLVPATYHWRVGSCTNSVCSGTVAWSGFRNFIVNPEPVGGSKPTVTTSVETNLLDTSATLHGSVNPNGLATFARFDWGPSGSFVCDGAGTLTPADDMGFGTATLITNAPISGLSPSIAYSFCLFAVNSAGTTLGSVRSFTTTAGPGAPTVTTVPAVNITSSSALLRGSANPNGSNTTGWFRWGTFAVCSDAVGNRAPLNPIDDATLGSGVSAQSYNQSISGLSPSTDYKFCAIAKNSVGTSLGVVETFTTPAAAGSFTITPITTSGNPLNCGTTPVGTPITCNFQAVNNSGILVVINNVSSSNPTEFTPNMVFPLPVQAGATVNLPIIFNATTAGSPHTSVITFTTTGGISRDIKGTATTGGGGACAAPNTCVATGSCTGSVVAGTCAAGNECCSTGAATAGVIKFENPLKVGSFTALINNIINFIFTIAVIIAPILLVIAGVIFMTAAGDPTKVATARRMLLWTIVGFGIILISKGLVSVLKGILGLTS